MPPKAKIDKQMILNACFELIQEKGCNALNVRSLSKKLGCSTQPIMYNFNTMEDILLETYQMVDEFHSQYILPKNELNNPLLELGLNYIRFGYKEKNLFCFLFQTNHFSRLNINALMEDDRLSPILQMVAMGFNCDEKKASEIFMNLFITAHGCASLLANNAMEYNEQHFMNILKNTFNTIGK